MIFQSLKIYISGTRYAKFSTIAFCTVVKLGKNLCLGGGSDHVGLMNEYSIQWHMGFKFSNSYHILHLFSLKHNDSIFLEKIKEAD